MKRFFLLAKELNHPKEKRFLQALFTLLGFVPGNLALYKQAFRHKSLSNSDAKGNVKLSNERLEYLGDAILSAVVADILFKKYPFRDEGFLTELRSKIVSRENLNKLSLKLGVPTFVEKSPDNNQRNRSINGDAFEALVGAVYLDKGYNVTKSFLKRRVLNTHIDIDELEQTEVNFKSRLIEWAQREKYPVRFEIMEERFVTGNKLIKVQAWVAQRPFGIGADYSKKKAEQVAAMETIKYLEAEGNDSIIQQ